MVSIGTGGGTCLLISVVGTLILVTGVPVMSAAGGDTCLLISAVGTLTLVTPATGAD